MNTYLHTFSRHRILLVAPLIISLFMAGWYVMSRPNVYAASTNVWFDTQAPNPSSIDASGNTAQPSSQAQAVLSELLSTRDFRLKVGHRGPLAAYFSRHRRTGASVDPQVDAALQHAVIPFVVGPQILGITMKGPAPNVTAGTLQAVVDQFSDELHAARRNRANDAITYFQSALVGAGKDLTTAESALTNYEIAHQPPGPGVTDPAMGPLVQAVSLAQSRYTDFQNNLSQATLQLNSADHGTNHVIDPPKANFSYLSIKKKLAFAGVGALMLGGLISLGVLALLTAADERARTVEDLEDLGLLVVGTIGQLPRSKRKSRRPEVA